MSKDYKNFLQFLFHPAEETIPFVEALSLLTVNQQATSFSSSKRNLEDVNRNYNLSASITVESFFV